MDKLFEDALPLLAKIEKAGFEAYFVGGAVRDHLLKREISDVDIATSATPQEVKRIFSNTVDVGIEHGTVVVLFKGQSYEITTFRTESEYKDFRRPDDVVFIRSLEEDLKRRDFTMNAMAMNKNGKLIDPFRGQEAIIKKSITAVGNAKERFSEDALRMMRAIRFVSQLAFSLDESCFQALKKMGSLLKHIAIERKATEFEKLLIGKNRLKALELLCLTDLDRYLPGLAELNVRVDKVIQFPCTELNLDEMWGLLLYSINIDPENIETFLRKWKLPVKRIREIQQINHWLSHRLKEKWSKETLFAAGKQMMIHTERVYNVINHQETKKSINQWIEKYDSLHIKSRSELTVSGNDLMIWLNRSSGPWIKECLSLVETAILEEKLTNEPNEIRKWVLSCNLK